MKKILVILGIILCCVLSSSVLAESSDTAGLKGYDGPYIPSGSYIPVMNTAEISTAFSDTNSIVKFIGTNDFYINDVNVLPRGTEFYGYIEKVNEPVIGTNGSMIIKMVKMHYSDGFEQLISGYIYSPNNNLIGGELTSPASYDAMPVYPQGFFPEKAYITMVPGATRQKGTDTVIQAGEMRQIILDKPIFIKHTLTD